MIGIAAPVFMGLLSTFALLLTLSRVDIRKFMGYPILLDLSGTLLYAALFHASLTGMMIAVVATLSLWLSITLYRRWFGYKRYSFKARAWVLYPPKYLRSAGVA